MSSSISNTCTSTPPQADEDPSPNIEAFIAEAGEIANIPLPAELRKQTIIPAYFEKVISFERVHKGGYHLIIQIGATEVTIKLKEGIITTQKDNDDDTLGTITKNTLLVDDIFLGNNTRNLTKQYRDTDIYVTADSLLRELGKIIAAKEIQAGMRSKIGLHTPKLPASKRALQEVPKNPFVTVVAVAALISALGLGFTKLSKASGATRTDIAASLSSVPDTTQNLIDSSFATDASVDNSAQ